MTAEQYPPAHGLPAKGRFKKAKSLQWGETPFDGLSRGELLRLVQAHHAAALGARSCLLMAKGADPQQLYWSGAGLGGEAIKRLDYLVSLAGDGGANMASESIYRTFFRYALGLLFGLKDRYHDWGINADGQLISPNPGEDKGFKPLSWSDLLPKESK